MTRLEYGKMVPHCGGKLCPEWYCLAEGDVVYIDYPYDKLPNSLKELAAKEAANSPGKLHVPRAKAVLPIKAPDDGAGSYHRTLGFPGPFIELPPPAIPLPFHKAPVIDHLTGEPALESSLPSVPYGIQQWENNFQGFQVRNIQFPEMPLFSMSSQSKKEISLAYNNGDRDYNNGKLTVIII